MSHLPDPQASGPYCGNCKYSLVGLTDSSRCPECGKPLVEVLQRPGWRIPGRRYTSRTRLFGLPLLHVASGPSETEPIGRARGIIAIGDDALGVLAVGGFARGVFALGGLSLGVVAAGGFSLGLLAFGGLALGGFALAGLAAGLLASGGLAAGIVAQGGLAIGYFARGGATSGAHTVTGVPGVGDAEAVEFFGRAAWLLGSTSSGMQLLPIIWWLVSALGLAVVTFAVLGLAYARSGDRACPEGEFMDDGFSGGSASGSDSR